MVLYLKYSPEDAYAHFSKLHPPIQPFRDASAGPSLLNLTIVDCLHALLKAQECHFFDFAAFDYQSYERYEKIENGEINWIIPNKIIAFCSPTFNDVVTPFGCVSRGTDFYLNIFL
jgi:cell division cycle 14